MQAGQTLSIDVPMPGPQPGFLLVRNRASAISSGTERSLADFSKQTILGKALARPDLVRQAWAKVRRDGLLAAWDAVRGRLAQPLPLGYSCAGVIVAVGDGVEGFQPGDRVACAGAGHASHAEFVSVPMNLCARVPEGVSDEAAAFTTLAAVALHGLRLAEPRMGETVTVIGLGLLGHLAVQLAKAAGCRVAAVDPDPARVESARRLGADFAGEPAQTAGLSRSASNGPGADIVLITAASSSSEPLTLAADACRDRGRVVLVGDVGMQLPRTPYFRKEITFMVSRSYGPGRYDPSYEEGGMDYPIGYVRWTEQRNLAESLRLMGEGKLQVSPLIGRRVPIADAPTAYELITGQSAARPLAVLLTYPQDAEQTRRVETAPRSSVPTSGGVSFVGAGSFAAGVLMPSLASQGAALRGVASGHGLSAAACAKRFGFAFAASGIAEVLDDPETAAVIVATRHQLHAQQALAVLSAGKHAFIEKPLCLDAQELQDIGALLQKDPRILLCVGFNRRFAPHTLAAKRFLAQQTGPQSILIRVLAGPLPDSHWLLDSAQGGGRLVGEGCHFLDWANLMAGSAPCSVQAWLVGAKPGMQDWTVKLHYPDGSSAEVLYSSAGDPSIGKERYEVHRGPASAILDNFRSLTLSCDGRTRTQRAWLRADKGHNGLLADFLRAVRDGGSPPIPWADIDSSMRTVFAARESLQKGRPVAL